MLEPVLAVALAVSVVAAVILGFLWTSARTASSRANTDIEGLKSRLTALETDSRKSNESLEAKRLEIADLKERLKDVKKRRHEEKEAARIKRDIQTAREEIEREMEHHLAQAREEAETAKASVKKLTAEIETLKSRRAAPAPAPVAQAASTEAAKPAKEPAAPRELSSEEKARLDAAERNLTKAKQKIDELQEEVKRAKGRAETDKRVFLVQKGEVELLKDKYRGLESRYNSLALERDEMRKAVWLLEKELKSVKPVAEEPAPEAAKAPAEASEVVQEAAKA